MQPALALRPQPLRAHAPIRKGLSARHTAPIYSRPSVAAQARPKRAESGGCQGWRRGGRRQPARPGPSCLQAVYNVKFVNPTGEETTIEVADDELILDAGNLG